MIRRLITTLMLINVVACTPRPAPQTLQPTEASTIPLPSDWAGQITHADGSVESILVRLTDAGGTFNIQPKTQTLEVEDFKKTGGLVSFEVTGQHQIGFSGRLDGSRITGQLEETSQSGSFSLLQLRPEASSPLVDFTGTYRFGSGETLLINLAPEYSQSGMYFFGPGLMITHFGNGAIRGLYSIAKDSFLVGSARALGYPFAEQIIFQRDQAGKVNGLLWQALDPDTGEPSNAKMATRLEVRSEIVHFTSEDGTELTGLLTLPATAGPYPAIMMLHGSEPGTRDNFGSQQMSAFMASHGIAILTYDKRGAGDSGGSYLESATEANLKLTAQDSIAGVNYLKSRPDILADRIGLTGFSQAGWVIPLAASQSEDIAYFIILSGPVTSVGHENLYSTYTNDGDSAPTTSEGELAKLLAAAPPSGFDPVPVLERLDQPGLWLWGDQDKSIPAFECEQNLKALIEAGKSNFSYRVLSNVDHNLQQTTQGLFNEIPYSPGFHREYYRVVNDWLGEHVR